MRISRQGKRVAMVVTLALILVPSCLGTSKSWNKIRYQTGTIEVKVNPFDWNTSLKIDGPLIEINFAGRKKISIESRSVTSLYSGEAAYRRISELVSRSGSSRPVPLFGMLQGDKEHLIGLEFTGADGAHTALLLFVQKDGYHDLLQALSELTRKSVKEIP